MKGHECMTSLGDVHVWRLQIDACAMILSVLVSTKLRMGGIILNWMCYMVWNGFMRVEKYGEIENATAE